MMFAGRAVEEGRLGTVFAARRFRGRPSVEERA
jgi:hypothetical protein